ncbi:hypothetical protein IMZ48_36055 [Candidatus Bathyarchaeota archaeon]|nr:hypothetical protein [Candidatus Bathyarchaeota archaeon]
MLFVPDLLGEEDVGRVEDAASVSGLRRSQFSGSPDARSIPPPPQREVVQGRGATLTFDMTTMMTCSL